MYLFNEDFWIAISFLIFIYLAYSPVKGMILQSLEHKILIIKQQVLESKKLTEDMELLFANTVNQLQSLEALRQEMLANSKEATAIMLQEQDREIIKFLENKKLNTSHLINMQNSKSFELLHAEFCNKIVELAALYLQATQNEGKLDIDIAKKFIDSKSSMTPNPS